MAALETPCTPHNKSLDKDGYSLKWVGRKKYLAHRYFYIQRYGNVRGPLDHLCGNRWCVNTDHLEPVTVAENTRRGKSAKLDYSKVDKIKKMYNSGKYKQTELANLFGVGQDQISRIVNSQRWAVV